MVKIHDFKQRVVFQSPISGGALLVSVIPKELILDSLCLLQGLEPIRPVASNLLATLCFCFFSYPLRYLSCSLGYLCTFNIYIYMEGGRRGGRERENVMWLFEMKMNFKSKFYNVILTKILRRLVKLSSNPDYISGHFFLATASQVPVTLTFL